MKKRNEFELTYANGKTRKCSKEKFYKVILENNKEKYDIEKMSIQNETNNMTREQLINSFSKF